jgi:hypothetical protein
VAEESELVLAASICTDKHFATALVSFEDAGFDFTKPIAARALARWRVAGFDCVLPKNGLPGESLLAWHLAQLVEWQLPVKSPTLVATGSHLEFPRGPDPELLVGGLFRNTAEWLLPRWLIGRQQSLLLMETESGVVCGGFADSAWVLGRVRANERMSSTYFVLEHPSGETRKWTKTGSNARFAAAGRIPFMCFGKGRLVVFEPGYIRTSAGEELSEEDAVFICGGGQAGHATMAFIVRWEFWRT